MAADRPVKKSDLLGAEFDQLVFYSEFFFLKMGNNILIWLRTSYFVFDCLFELGMTIF